MSWMKSVYSSMVSEVGWDDQTNEILIKWAGSGKTSGYGPATEDVADECSRAPSVGQFVISEIKPNYGHRYR
jgi:hypothetical protein